MVRCHDYLSPKPACNIYRAVFFPYPAASSTSKDEAGNRCMTCAFKRLYDTLSFRPFLEPSTLGSLRFIEHAAVDAFECFSMPCPVQPPNLKLYTAYPFSSHPTIDTLTGLRCPQCPETSGSVPKSIQHLSIHTLKPSDSH